MPFIIKNHSGKALEQRLDRFIKAMKNDGRAFVTFMEFVNRQKKSV